MRRRSRKDQNPFVERTLSPHKASSDRRIDGQALRRVYNGHWRSEGCPRISDFVIAGRGRHRGKVQTTDGSRDMRDLAPHPRNLPRPYGSPPSAMPSFHTHGAE